MSFNLANLSALSYSNGFTLWHYKTTDILREGDNYWSNPSTIRMFRLGDHIICNSGINTPTPAHHLLVVVHLDEKEQTVGIVSLAGVRLVVGEDQSNQVH